ncbi:MAG: hypothetical protein ABI384_04220 [Allobranchiibius sp.]
MRATGSAVLATSAGRSYVAPSDEAGAPATRAPGDAESIGGRVDENSARKLTWGTRWMVAAGVVVLSVSLSASYVALRSTPPRVPDGVAYGRVRLSSDPGLRWQRNFEQIAPDLGCPTAVTQDNPSVDACSVTASATVDGLVVVAVQRSQRAELVGLATRDGSVKWRRQSPTGSTYDCMVTGGRLWCLSVPLFYPVIEHNTPNGATDGSFDVLPRRSAAYRSASLVRLEPTTGAVVAGSPVPGSGVGAAFAGVGRGGFYVLGRGPTPAGTVVRYSGRGEMQWSHRVTLVLLQSSSSTLTRRVATPQVHELQGRALVSLAQVAGRQAAFTVVGGAPVRSAVGHIVTVLGRTVVSQVGSGTLRVDGHEIPENALAVLSADDRSGGEPLLVTQFSAVDPNGPGAAGSAGFTLRSPPHPTVGGHSLQARDQPVAYCAGVVLTLADGAVAGYDSVSGVRRWTAGVLDGADLQVRCNGSQVVFANSYQATAFSLDSGTQIWTVSYPLGSIVTGGGFGDPPQGLLAGPSNNTGLPTGTTSVSYLR